MQTFACLCVNINILHLGEPELCHGFQSNFTFDGNSSPKINITLCGIPQPKVEAKFLNLNLNVKNETVSSCKHDYTLQLPQLTQAECGKVLTVKASNKIGTLTSTTKIFVDNCKYHYYINLNFVLSFL